MHRLLLKHRAPVVVESRERVVASPPKRSAVVRSWDRHLPSRNKWSPAAGSACHLVTLGRTIAGKNKRRRAPDIPDLHQHQLVRRPFGLRIIVSSATQPPASGSHCIKPRRTRVNEDGARPELRRVPGRRPAERARGHVVVQLRQPREARGHAHDHGPHHGPQGRAVPALQGPVEVRAAAAHPPAKGAALLEALHAGPVPHGRQHAAQQSAGLARVRREFLVLEVIILVTYWRLTGKCWDYCPVPRGDHRVRRAVHDAARAVQAGHPLVLRRLLLLRVRALHHRLRHQRRRRVLRRLRLGADHHHARVAGRHPAGRAGHRHHLPALLTCAGARQHHRDEHPRLRAPHPRQPVLHVPGMRDAQAPARGGPRAHVRDPPRRRVRRALLLPVVPDAHSAPGR
ncbi:hypothetical protein ON010_g2797 [Phytophthora cinnamomi]|nr:hypothetical protein ON010_g2797 [Phytophthora cinnamomi]